MQRARGVCAVVEKLNILVILYTTKNIFQTIVFLIQFVSLYEVMDMRLSCYECAALWRESPHGFASTRLRIGQNCRAVCTKKSGLRP